MTGGAKLEGLIRTREGDQLKKVRLRRNKPAYPGSCLSSLEGKEVNGRGSGGIIGELQKEQWHNQLGEGDE